MFTRNGSALTGVGTTLFVLGVLTGNFLVMLVAVLPLLVALAASLEKPADAKIARAVSHARVERESIVEVTLRVVLPKGSGLVEIHQPLPAPFTLAKGSNLHVMRLGRAAREEVVTFAFVATKRGRYVLAPVHVRYRHALGLLEPVSRIENLPKTVLEVTPRVLHTRARETDPAPARHLIPAGDVTRFGPPGTDFRDIRTYAWGDPPKTINWKATARRLAASADATPLVNEFEREGKKSIWIVLDAGPALEIGDDIDNALERAIEGAVAVAHYFLKRGHRVGVLVANAGVLPHLPSEGGSEQLRRLVRLLTRVRSEDDGGLVAAVTRARGHLRQGRPYIIVLGRLSPTAPGSAEGLRALASITRGTRGRSHGLVIDVRPHGLEARHLEVDVSSRRVAEAMDRPVVQLARASGFPCTSWDPAVEGFPTAFARATSTTRRARRRGASTAPPGREPGSVIL